MKSYLDTTKLSSTVYMVEEADPPPRLILLSGTFNDLGIT